MRYIFTHRNSYEIYQLFLPDEVSLDDYKKWVEGGKAIFAFTTKDGLMTSVDQSAMFGECDISNPEQHIILPRNNDLNKFFINVMGNVGDATSSEYLPVGEKKIRVVKKAEEEILAFDGDFKTVPFKYIDFFQKSIGAEIVFSQEDSKSLKKAVDAAYFVMVDKGDVPEWFEKCYDQYFRTK